MKVRHHEALAGSQLMTLWLPPFHRDAGPIDPVAMRGWRVENLGAGDVALFKHAPSSAPIFLCKLASGELAEFGAAGVIFESLDHFGAMLTIMLWLAGPRSMHSTSPKSPRAIKRDTAGE
jgi:hypothetical protein